MKHPGPQAARLVSLDAYRGAIMLLMASGGLGLARATRDLDPGSPWKWIAQQFEHTEWAGATLWDFIQPAFMFMVGVALPWSLASRTARGQHFGVLLVHAFWRSLVLVLLAVFLTSAWSPQYELGIHQRPGPDRPGVPVAVPPGVHPAPDAMVRRLRHPDRVLARLRTSSAAGVGLRLEGRRRARRLAAPGGLRRPLGEGRQLAPPPSTAGS